MSQWFGVKPKIIVRIAIFVSLKQTAFKKRDKIAYINLASAKTPVTQDESMLPPVPPQDGLDTIDCSANKDKSGEFISPNSTASEHDTKEVPSYFQRNI